MINRIASQFTRLIKISKSFCLGTGLNISVTVFAFDLNVEANLYAKFSGGK